MTCRARRYFFSSSACAYNTDLQRDPKVRALKESDAYPAMAERGYGWEKLISEMFCQEYWAERGMKTAIATSCRAPARSGRHPWPPAPPALPPGRLPKRGPPKL
jgi:nucleoside-diphosphate-sugar epimerase